MAPADRRRRRRHRRLRTGRQHAGDPARPARTVGDRARAVARALPAATSGALRPRGRAHLPVVRHRRRAASDQRARRHLRVAQRGRHDAAALRPGGRRTVGLAGVVDVQPARRSRRCSTGARGALPNIDVRRGVEVTGLDQHDDRVVVHARRRRAPPPRRYVVGCDGANSTVRDARRVAGDRPRLLLRLADRRRGPRRATRVRPDQPADLRPGAADDRGVGRPRPPPVGVHAPAARIARRAERRERAWELLAPWDVHPGNARSNATPSTRSTRATPSSGAPGACSSPATPPT